ncbi:MAG: helix-turn-helix transcriptional regulator [Kiritimatiellae bacterium]|nr:helix-turn-helix transcriptional regulator [Kiritimatiellia bacterium]
MNWLDRIAPQIDGSAGARLFEGPVINPLRVIANHELFLFGPGDARMVIAGQAYACACDSFVIVPPGVAHISYVESAEPVMVHWAHFNWEPVGTRGAGRIVTYMPEVPDARTFRPAPDYVPRQIFHGTVRRARVYELHGRAARLYGRQDARARRLSRAIFLEELLELLLPEETRLPAGSLEIVWADKCRDRLSRLADEPLSRATPVKAALRELGPGYPHLERLFRQVHGLSPLQYVNVLRMERIKGLLRDTDQPVSHIAAELGFADASYFSRFFRRRAGCSPRAFRAIERVPKVPGGLQGAGSG